MIHLLKVDRTDLIKLRVLLRVRALLEGLDYSMSVRLLSDIMHGIIVLEVLLNY